MKKPPPPDASDLRRRAEARLKSKQKGPPPVRTEAGTLRLLHELEVHQIELEMQNEELQRSRAEVEAGLERYTDLYDFAPVGYFTLDPVGTILQLNLAGARLLGAERARLVGRRFGLFVQEGDRPAFAAILERVLSSGGRECCEVALASEGHPLFFAHIEGMVSPDGPTCRAAVTDITERKNLQESLNASHKLETMGIITGGVAHEVRNPLFAISTVSAALEKKFGGNPEIKPYVDHIQEHVQRLSRLMDDLLVLGRPVQKSSFRPTVLQEVIRKSLDQLSSGWPVMVAACQVILPEEAMVIEGSSDSLAQVFVNLLQNAFSYSDGSGAVRVGLHREDGWAVVTIRDQGPGIPPEVLPKLFHNYATSRKGGTGLGLAIAEKIVAAHGGTITAGNNEPPPGACFTMRLPLGESEK